MDEIDIKVEQRCLEYQERNMELLFKLEDSQKKIDNLESYRMPEELCNRLQRIEDVMHDFLLLLSHQKQSRTKSQKNNISKSLRLKILDRDNNTCQNCSKCVKFPFTDTSVLHIDHIIPRSKGGLNNEDNLQVLCSSCNLLKKNYLFNEVSKNTFNKKG